MSHTPTEAAKLVGVSKSTVIRWAGLFSDHLSDQASPEPGQRRAFTEADITVLRRAKRLLSSGVTLEEASAQLAVIEPEEAEHEAPAGRSSEEHEAQERAQSSQAGQALMVLTQQQRIIDGQAAQLTDQAARLREQASQVASQAAELAALRERLARVEEAQRQQERRRFRWPWEPRPEE